MVDDVTFTSGANSTPPDTTKVATYEDGSNGHVQRVVLAGPDEWQANDNQSTAQTDTVLKAAGGASTNLYMTDFIFSTDTAMEITLVSNTASSTDLIGPYYFPANSGDHMRFLTPLKVPTNVNLGYTSSAAGNHTVTVLGFLA